MKPELEYLITEAGAEAVTDLLLTCKRATDAEPLIRRLYPRYQDPKKKHFRFALAAVLRHRREMSLRGLTPAQRKTLIHLCNGLSQKEAASRMQLAISTVSKHCLGICRKVGTRTVLQAVAKLANFNPEEKL